MRTFLVFLFAVTALPAAAPPTASVEDAYELIVLHEKRPYRIRFHLHLAGRSYRASWTQQVRRLFAHLDTDGNGQLSPAELSRAPSREQWRQISAGMAIVDPDAAPDFASLSRKQGGIRLSALVDYYATSTAGPLQLGWSRYPRSVDPASDALWKVLDVNRDGHLSRGELKAARSVLTPFDRNDDELLSREDILAVDGNFDEGPLPVTPGAVVGPAADGLPFYSYQPGSSPTRFVQTLLSRYDQDGSNTLSRRELDLPASQFARLDQDNNGQLDAAEFPTWLNQPSDVELIVPLDDADRPIRERFAPAVGIRLRTSSLLVRNWIIELHRDIPPTRESRQRSLEINAFKTLDTDNNSYLDKDEIYRPPFTYVAWLRLADSDSDEKITEKEFVAFARLQASIHGQVTFLRVIDQRRSLFRLLDTGGDGRLGPREILSAWDRLSPWAQVRDRISRQQVPAQYRLLLGVGSVRTEMSSGIANEPVVRRRRAAGPLWFRKMDSNGDGDVSRREWLGSTEQFRQFDRDSDGLLSLDEARLAERRFRTSKK